MLSAEIILHSSHREWPISSFISSEYLQSSAYMGVIGLYIPKSFQFLKLFYSNDSTSVCILAIFFYQNLAYNSVRFQLGLNAKGM